MSESPHVLIRRRQPAVPDNNEFLFNQKMVRMTGTSQILDNYRLQAWKSFTSKPIPTISEEAWRRTDLRSLCPDRFRYPEGKHPFNYKKIPTRYLSALTNEQHSGEVVITPTGNKTYLTPELSSLGVVFTSLLDAEVRYPEIINRIVGRVIKPEEDKFSALAGALAQDGVILYIPKGVHISSPLHGLVWGFGSNIAFLTHLMIFLEEDSSVTYVHETASSGDDEIFYSGLVEIFVGSGASLQFVELQSWSEKVWNITHEGAQVDRDGKLDWIFGAVGSHLTKNFSTINLIGQGSTGKMSGFYFSDHKQHLDHDTQQNHLAPRTTSDLLFKGALLGDSRSVWQGMIYVAPGAVKADGYQANRNLVLSQNARADSIPGLEILTDDVRCTHGATVGKIDKEQIYYLISRGIAKAEAEMLIVEGFFDPIMQRIPFEGVRQRFQRTIREKIIKHS